MKVILKSFLFMNVIVNRMFIHAKQTTPFASDRKISKKNYFISIFDRFDVTSLNKTKYKVFEKKKTGFLYCRYVVRF